MKILTQTNNRLLSISMLMLRCTVGIILFIAGAEKMMGWFGGRGLEATVDAFVSNMSIPAFLAYLCCFTEFIGGFLLIIGLLTRPVAVAVTINMLVATWELSAHRFFLLSHATYPFSLMVSSVVILFAGPMDYSIDWLIFHGLSFKLRSRTNKRKIA